MADIISITSTDQPKPKFNLNDLEEQLTACYSILLKGITPEDIRECTGKIQGLLADVSRCKQNLESIDLPALDTNKEITTVLNTEKPEFSVCGVQLWEPQGKQQICTGTSLYTTVFKARKIRDILNAKFAELKVNHEAKIINYPVF